MESTDKSIESITAALRNRYLERFGPPTREARYCPPSRRVIEIWKWVREATTEGVCIYATVGAAGTMRSGVRRCEFFLGLSPEVDSVAESLAEVAIHGTGTGRVPSSGDTITLSQPLWNGAEMRSLLVTDGGEQIISPIEVGGISVEFLQLVPLFANEVEFKSTNGEKALWNLFQSRSTPYWDSARRSSVD